MLDSFSTFEVRKAVTALEIFKKTESNDAFSNHFQPIACFVWFYLFFFIRGRGGGGGCHQRPEN